MACCGAGCKGLNSGAPQSQHPSKTPDNVNRHPSACRASRLRPHSRYTQRCTAAIATAITVAKGGTTVGAGSTVASATTRPLTPGTA